MTAYQNIKGYTWGSEKWCHSILSISFHVKFLVIHWLLDYIHNGCNNGIYELQSLGRLLLYAPPPPPPPPPPHSFQDYLPFALKSVYLVTCDAATSTVFIRFSWNFVDIISVMSSNLWQKIIHSLVTKATSPQRPVLCILQGGCCGEFALYICCMEVWVSTVYIHDTRCFWQKNVHKTG